MNKRELDDRFYYPWGDPRYETCSKKDIDSLLATGSWVKDLTFKWNEHVNDDYYEDCSAYM